MKKITTIFSLCCLALLCCCNAVQGRLHPDSGVTYTLSGGRFGDNLVAVAHAKWIAYALELPLVYRPFPYAEQLKLSTDPSVLKPEQIAYSKIYTLNTAHDYLTLWHQHLLDSADFPALISVPYFPDTEHDLSLHPSYPLITEANWDDPLFIEELRALIAPLTPFPKPCFPKDRLTVALHVRTGRGFDDASLSSKFPLKSPPLTYYVDAINCLLGLTQFPLYVFLFTDDPSPTALQRYFIHAFQKRDILFDCRPSGNRHDSNVLEDFFSLEYFDCLIRTGSNFSFIASQLFPFRIVLAPVNFTRDRNDRITIDRILMQVRPKEGSRTPVKTVIRKS